MRPTSATNSITRWVQRSYRGTVRKTFATVSNAAVRTAAVETRTVRRWVRNKRRNRRVDEAGSTREKKGGEKTWKRVRPG